MVKKNMGKADTMRSVTARLPTRMANVVRSFFSNLYDRRTSRLAAVLTITTANRNVHRPIRPEVMFRIRHCDGLIMALCSLQFRMVSPAVMVRPPSAIVVAVANAAVVKKPADTLLSAVLIIRSVLPAPAVSVPNDGGFLYSLDARETSSRQAISHNHVMKTV